jgi:hypothetical protein
MAESKINIIINKDYWTAKEAKENKTALYIFGDNLKEKGKGGQACIRGLSNALGIPTKKFPSMNEDSFFSDSELKQNIKHIDQSIEKIKKAIKIKQYQNIIFPPLEDREIAKTQRCWFLTGLGTGLAFLPSRAPKTYTYLCSAVQKLVEDLGHSKI